MSKVGVSRPFLLYSLLSNIYNKSVVYVLVSCLSVFIILYKLLET